MKVWQYTVGQTWTLGPKLTLDSTIGVATMDTTAKTADYFQGMIGLQQLGIPGTNDQGSGDERYSGLPNFVTGFQALGNAVGFIPNTRADRTVSGGLNVTRFAGQHEFKGGYTFSQMTLDHWNPEGANPRGSFTFASNATRTFGTGAQTANFYNQYAAFLLGLVGTANKSYPIPAVHRRGVAARRVLPRSLERQPEADAGSRAPLGVLPGHGPGRSRQGHRAARPRHAGGGARRRRRKSPRASGSMRRRTTSRRGWVRCIA